MSSRFDADVLIVGARCAGAALAAFLARSGARVLLIDRARLPSDQVLSTHTLHPAGMRVLERLGVAGAIRARAPAMTQMRLVRRTEELVVELAPHQHEYCPRRERLDAALQDEAAASGAEVRDRTRLHALCWTGDRVTGAILQDGRGTRHEIRARWVIGADGRTSTVATLAGAVEYHAYDAPRAMYWGYWRAPQGHAPELYIGRPDAGIRVVFCTDDDHLLLGSLPHLEDAAAWRADPLGALTADLRRDPYTGALCSGPPVEPVRGIVRSRYFFRAAAGPGWALAGDAGVHKEYVTGDGMSEALLQAERLAGALLEDTDAALLAFWHARDVAALPWFLYGRDQGRAGPANALEARITGRFRRSPRARAKIAASLEHRASPLDAATLGDVVPALIGELLRGRWSALRDFEALGRRGAEVQRAIASSAQTIQALRSARGATLAPVPPEATPAAAQR